MTSETYTFGNNRGYEATRLSLRENGSINTDKITIVRHPGISEEHYKQALDDINHTFQVLVDPQTGKQFEVASANTRANPGNGVDIEISTYTSSISGNTANAIEFAENSALHPDRQRVYVASSGNGRTSYWDEKEQSYIRRTGRFTQENGQALPTIAALNRVLQLNGFVVTRISTNSAGGAYATALMRELPEGQVTHAYLKSRPNISDHPLGLIWGLSILVSDVLDDSRFKKASKDPWKEKITQSSIQTIREQMPNIYAPGSISQPETLKGTRTHNLGKMWTDMIAFSRGNSAKGHPAAVDTFYALTKQSAALVTYHFPFKDRIYNKLPEDARDFLNAVCRLSGMTINSQIEVLLMPGGHRDHTSYPSLRWSVEMYAFQR